MILRLADLLKSKGVATMSTNLTHGNVEHAMTDMQVSSLMDTWFLLYTRESNGEDNRELCLIKSRGMAPSNQVREFVMTSKCIVLRDVYIGPEGVPTGPARVSQEARKRSIRHKHEVKRRSLEFTRRRRRIEAQMRCGSSLTACAAG